MSRVEEARQRARGPEGASFPGELGPPDADESVLECYPRERGGQQQPAPPPLAVRSVAPVRSEPLPPQSTLDPRLDGKLVGSPDTPPIAVEQYRRLAASLHQLQADAGLKTLMVTSALPREGKTLTVTNLALTLSESYRKRVLVIDADLRRPSLHEVFQIRPTDGLTQVLRSGGRPNLIEVSPCLSILTAGELDDDPLAALTSDRMAALLAYCAAAFDWVLLDAPPVGLMPDGNVLARLTKAVVFVIAAGTTPFKQIERSVTELGRDYIVGTVLNRIDDHELPVASAYSRYYATPHPS